MPEPALLDRLRAAVDAGFEAETGFLAELVRFPSKRGNEAPLQDWMARQLAARGYEVDRFSIADVPLADHPKAAPMVEVDPARSIQVVGTRRCANPAGRSLLMQGHIDVVPEGPAEMWTHPPFNAVIRDNKMYGRGAYDMKAGVACLVAAMDAIAAAGLEPAADIHLATVTEEESTGNGALATVVRGYRADAALIPESTGETLTRAHTGTLWFRLRVLGIPVHVMVAQSGSNAILSAFRLIQALQEHTVRLNETAKSHPIFGTVENPIKFNPGIIRGGDWASSTPAWCEVDCRIGLLPGQDPLEMRAAVEKVVAEAARGDDFLANNPPSVSWHGFLADGSVLEPGSEAESVFVGTYKQIYGGEVPDRRSTAVNDTRYYALYANMPSLCFGPDGFGPHAFDEYVDLESLRRTTLLIAAFIADWCGVRERGA